MKTLLLIKSSLFEGAGQSSALADHYAGLWQARHAKGRVIERDLAADPLPHLDGDAFAGFVADANDRSPEQQRSVARSDTLIAELKQADEVLIALPMYNFTVPSSFKAWMDHVARAGVTFKYTEQGPVGLLDNKPVVVISTRGGHYAGTSADTQTSMVKMFLGMLGLSRVEFVYAEGLALGPESAERSKAEARAQIESLAAGAAAAA